MSSEVVGRELDVTDYGRRLGRVVCGKVVQGVLASSSEAAHESQSRIACMQESENVLGWRVGWRVARRSFLSMCKRVCRPKWVSSCSAAQPASLVPPSRPSSTNNN